VNGHHVDAIEKIFPKSPLFNFLSRSLDVAAITLTSIFLPPPLRAGDFLFLEHPKQFHLKRKGQFSDLVEEHGAGVCLFEPAWLVLYRIRESAPLVAEKLAFRRFSGMLPQLMDTMGAEALAPLL